MQASTVLVAAAAFASVVGALGVQDPVTVCYVGTWAAYRNGQGKFEVENIDAQLCDHFMYAFAGINASGEVVLLDEWLDIELKTFARFVALREKNPKAKIFISVGGWNQGSTTFSSVANSPDLRNKFAENALAFCQKYGFDGFDLDWEYPGTRGGAATDKAAYVDLIRALHEKLSAAGLLLTAAVSVGESNVDVAYDVPEMMKYLDLVHLMVYDLHSADEGTTGMNAALKAAPDDADKNLNVEGALQVWMGRGAVAAKLTLGIPLYGKTFTLQSAANAGVGAAVTGRGQAGPFTAEAGTLGYNELCAKQVQGTFAAQWDEAREVPYAVQGDQWVSYDNVRSVELKAKKVQELGLAGAMVWSLETDDFNNDCATSGGKFPLLRAVYRTLHGSEPSSSTTSPTPSPISTSLSPSSTPSSTSASSAASTRTSFTPSTTSTSSAAPTGTSSIPSSTPSPRSTSSIPSSTTTSSAAPTGTSSIPSSTTTSSAAPTRTSSTSASSLASTHSSSAAPASTSSTPTSPSPSSTPSSVHPTPATNTTPGPATTAPGGSDVCQVAGAYERDSRDCGAFYYCGSVGQPHSRFPFHCASELYFDLTLSTCNWKSQVPC